MVDVVLAYIEKDNKYLMLLRNKRLKDLNKNKYVGVGGHVEVGESNDMAMIREIKEETNLDVLEYKYRGVVYFNNGLYEENMYLYHVTKFSGIVKECDEGTLYWVDKKDIFNLNLWEGDKYFLKPFMETDKLINLKMYYKGDKLVRWEDCENK